MLVNHDADRIAAIYKLGKNAGVLYCIHVCKQIRDHPTDILHASASLGLFQDGVVMFDCWQLLCVLSTCLVHRSTCLLFRHTETYIG